MERGYVLFWTLAALALLAWLAALLLSSTGRQMENRDTRTRLLALSAALASAEAEAKAALLADPTSQPLLPLRREASSNATKVVWELDNEASRFDLNRANPAALRELFTAHGMQLPQADHLADAIADWRDDDDLRRLNGAERADYEAAGIPGPANATLSDVSELTRVLGAADADLSCIVGRLTVFGTTDGGVVDPTKVQPSQPRAGEAVRLTVVATDAETGMTRREVSIYRLTGNRNDPIWLLDRNSSPGPDRKTCRDHAN